MFLEPIDNSKNGNLVHTFPDPFDGHCQPGAFCIHGVCGGIQTARAGQ
jgi:hypothetical protein